MPKRAKSTITTHKLFPRHRPAPLAVQDKAGLWLDLYVDFATGIVTTDRDGTMTPTRIVGYAECLADLSLDAFEKRWPTAMVPCS